MPLTVSDMTQVVATKQGKARACRRHGLEHLVSAGMEHCVMPSPNTLPSKAGGTGLLRSRSSAVATDQRGLCMHACMVATE